MASSVGFHVDGLNQLVRDLQAVGVEVEDLKEAFSGIAREGAEVAAGFAPRLSGRLAGNIRGNRAKSKAVVTAGGASVPYAAPINYGWAAHNISASGFLQKTDEVMQPRALRELESAINTQIRRRGLS